ncbi:hypothetical protein CEXT_446971 [Caerostris extrusa]|uniref:Uncharacterized protein n=1 Tax=Caerostris extrusa TaxID=172846 RepID=A0AAV4M4U4_CAEEX|nr:hypothetical protein CEXT_446971 [Caerostris extrusa]
MIYGRIPPYSQNTIHLFSQHPRRRAKLLRPMDLDQIRKLQIGLCEAELLLLNIPAIDHCKTDHKTMRGQQEADKNLYHTDFKPKVREIPFFVWDFYQDTYNTVACFNNCSLNSVLAYKAF